MRVVIADMHDINRLTIREMTEYGNMLRNCGKNTTHMEQAAQNMVDQLYSLLGDAAGDNACALARFFKTHPYGSLPLSLQQAAGELMGGQSPTDDMKCLTLLATRGKCASWNERENSCGHQAIPLPNTVALAAIPMLSQLVSQLGVPVETLFAPDPAFIADLTQRTYNVFYVPEAAGSPYVPAQDDFVRPHDIRTVIGFGGVLPSADIFAVILFLRTPVSPAVASMFKPLAVSAKLGLLASNQTSVFNEIIARKKEAA
jgi:two-component system NtrC family sensor kinase